MTLNMPVEDGANELLSRSPLALLVAMLLDQRQRIPGQPICPTLRNQLAGVEGHGQAHAVRHRRVGIEARGLGQHHQDVDVAVLELLGFPEGVDPFLDVGRFIGFVRPLSPVIAGASGMPPRRFVPFAFVAAGLWSVTFCLLGYFFWQSLDQVAAIAEQGTLALGGAIAVLVVLIVLYRHLRRRAAGPSEARATPLSPRA